VAMPGSLEEVEQVLSDRGQPLDFKTIRAIASRFASRARAAQRAGSLNWGESVAGRRVVLSTEGGRIRIRTTKRGPKTAKGRHRSRTDGREPKLRIIYYYSARSYPLDSPTTSKLCLSPSFMETRS
jgi:hypothetical protein